MVRTNVLKFIRLKKNVNFKLDTQIKTMASCILYSGTLGRLDCERVIKFPSKNEDLSNST